MIDENNPGVNSHAFFLYVVPASNLSAHYTTRCMKMLKRLLLAFAVLFVVLQFIRPPRNSADTNMANDVSAKFTLSRDVQTMLQTSCYDCHSNTTRYPWYAEVQPVGWWLNDHIQDAKRELNFSEFGSYRLRRQYRKFEEIGGEVEQGKMPLPSYLIIHTDARLSQEQKERLISWANALRDSMKAMYPVDSLERK